MNFSIITPVFSLLAVWDDPSEIILICLFGAQLLIMVLIVISVENLFEAAMELIVWAGVTWSCVNTHQ